MIISIIIPVYGHWGETLACIEAVLKNTNPELNYEIIVADDSPDDSSFIEPAFHQKRIKYFKNGKNLGFLRNCNNAVSKAQGELLVFLNSDTLPQPFWLDWLVKTFEYGDKIGIVGAKLLNPCGTLQEAGAIVWNNALGNRYGCGDNPQYSHYNYLKETDYVSFACAAVLRSVWDLCGGFDEQFAPAYKEDVDICFNARKNGYKVLYQPKCEVVHIGGLSYLSNPEAMKKHEVNHKLFLKKWDDELKKHDAPDTNLFFARDRTHGKKVIFAVLSHSPEDDIFPNALVWLNFFKDLGLKVVLHLLKPVDADLSDLLQQDGIELAQDLQSFVLAYSSKIDYLFCSHPDTMDIMIWLRDKTRAKAVYYGNLMQCYYSKRFSNGFNHKDYLFFTMYKQKEVRLLEMSDKFLVPTYSEMEYIKQNYPEYAGKSMIWNAEKCENVIFD